MIFYKINDWLNNRKTISGQFIIDNKICTVYVLKKDKNKFRVKYGLRTYKLSIFENTKTPKKISSWLDDYFSSNNRAGVNNWKWLMEDYSATCNDDNSLNIKKTWRYDEYKESSK